MIPLTESCTFLGCRTGELVCHRCGDPGTTVREREIGSDELIVTDPLPCLAGTWPKVVASELAPRHLTHSCDSCATAYAALIERALENMVGDDEAAEVAPFKYQREAVVLTDDELIGRLRQIADDSDDWTTDCLLREAAYRLSKARHA